MIYCPNKNSKQFQDLISSVGKNRAYFLWDKYKGEVPSSYYIKQEQNDSITYAEALSIAKQFLPGFSERDLKFVTEKALGKNNLGEYRNGVASVLKDSEMNSKQYIVRHELFHKVFTEYLTKKEQDSLFRNFSKEYGERLSLFEFEEKLAEKFQSWKNNQEIPKSNLINIIFNKILRFFNLISANINNLDKFFNQIEKGKLSVKKQEVTTTVKNLNNITKIYGSANNFRELRDEMDTKVNEIQTQGYVNNRTYIYLDGFDHLSANSKFKNNELLRKLNLDKEITLFVNSLNGKNVDYQYLINKTIQVNPEMTEEDVRSIIDNYYNDKIQELKQLASGTEGPLVNYVNKMLSHLSTNKFTNIKENIFLNNHVNKDEVTAILRNHFSSIYRDYSNQMSILSKELSTLKRSISLEEDLNLKEKILKLENEKLRLNSLLRKYQFITDKSAFKYLYETSYPKLDSRVLTDIDLYDLQDFEEEEVDPEFKTAEFAFDAETKNMKTSIADSAKVILSNVIDKEKFDTKKNSIGKKLPFGYSYILAVKIAEGLDPSLSNFAEQIDNKVTSLDGTSSMKAVADTIKKIYEEATREIIQVNNKTVVLPKHAKFLDDKTFIISFKGVDLSDVKTIHDVQTLNENNKAQIYTVTKKQNNIGKIENTMNYSYRVLKEIEEQQYIYGIKNTEDFPHYFDTSLNGNVIINRLYYKMISNITFIELMQNLLSQKEKNRQIGLIENKKDGSIESTYRPGMQRTNIADVAKKVERAIELSLDSKAKIVNLRGSTFKVNNKSYKIIDALNTDYEKQFYAIKYFFNYIGFNKEQLDQISIDTFDITEDKINITRLYSDLYHFVYGQTKDKLQSLVQFDAKMHEKVQRKRELTEEEIQSLNEDKDLTALDIEDRINEGINYFTEPEVSDILEDNKSLLNRLANFLSSNTSNETQTMSVDAAGKKKYSHIPSSVAIDTLKRLEEGNLKLFDIAQQDQYAYLKSPVYKHNIFNPLNNKRLNIIEKQVEDDGYKVKYGFGTNETKSFYTKETLKEFYTRTFHLSFLKVAEDSPHKKLQYVQYLPIISNRPFASGAKVNMLNPVEIKKALNSYIEQYISRPDFDNVKNYNKNSITNFTIFKEAMDRLDVKSVDNDTNTSIKNALAEEMYNILHEKSKQIAKDILDNNVILDTDFKKVVDKLDSYIDKSLYSNYDKSEYKSNEKIKESVKSVKARLNADIKSGKFNTNYTEEEVNGMTENDLAQLGYSKNLLFDENKLLPIVGTFVSNWYINSYFLDQIIMGESSFFKDSTARTKRRQGVFAPGLIPVVNNKLGIKKNFRVAVVDDVVVNNINEFFKNLGMSDENIADLLKKFNEDGFNPTDAQGFMLPKRRDEIKQAVGLSYGLGNVLKPAHYEVDAMGIPRMMKYSSIVLTDELVNQFPMLGKVREKMVNKDVDELVFESAFKVGQPKLRVNPNDLFNDNFIINEKSIVKLSNYNYKLQLNPEHEVDSKVAKPTQLSYFLAIQKLNLPEAKQVYSAYGKITSLKLDSFLKELEITDNIVNNEKFISRLETSLEGGNSQRELQILSELSHYTPDSSTRREIFNKKSLAWNHPAITDKMFTQLVSITNNSVIKSDFRGSKLVLQSSWGTDNRYGQEKELQYKKDKDGKLYAEVVVPKGLLSKDIEDIIQKSIDKGEEVPHLFFNADLLGFRIPSSELHSGIALKVVAFYDSSKEGDNNVIIAPKYLVPLHGSDFDVDSLYVIRRNTFPVYPKIFDKSKNSHINFDDLDFIPGTYIGYTKVNNQLTLSNTENGITDTSIFENKIKELKNKYLLEYGESDIYNKIEKYFNNILIDYYQNIITETFLNVMQNQKNEDRMLSPIEMKTLKNDISENITEPYPNTNIAKGIDESLISDQQRVHSSSMNGRDGTGIAANDVKANAYMINASKTSSDGVPILKSIVEGDREVNKYKFYFTNEKGYNKLSNLREVWEIKDSILNAAIDNVKEQVLPQLNINGETMPIYMTMLSMKMSLTEVNKIMSQPSVRFASSISGKVNEDNVQKSKGIIQAKAILKAKIKEISNNDSNISDIINNIDEALIYTDKAEHLVITPEAIQAGLKVTDVSKTPLENLKEIKDLENLINQYKIISNIEKVFNLSRHVTNMSRYLSIIRDLPVFFDEYKSKIDTFNTIFEQAEDEQGLKTYITKDSFPFEIDNFFEVNPHIKEVTHVLFKIKDIAENNFFKYSPVLNSLERNTAMKNIILDVNQNKNNLMLRNEYLKSIFNSFYDYSNQVDYKLVTFDNKVTSIKRQQAFTQHFNNKIFLLSLLEKNNQFLSKINLVNNSKFYKNLYYLDYNNSSKLDISEMLDLIDNFKELNKYNIDEITQEEYLLNKTNESYKVLLGNYYKINDSEDIKGYSNLQKDFIKYAILNYGLGLGKNNYSAFLPTDSYREDYYKYENFLKDLTSINDNMDNFEIDFILNHGDKLMDFKKVISKKEPGYENGVFYDIVINNDLPNSKKYLKWGTSLYIRVSDKSKDLGKVYYQYLGKVNKTKFYTSQIKDGEFEAYNIADKFNPSIFTLKLESIPVNKSITVYNKVLEKLENGTIIQITDNKDNQRRYSDFYKINRIDKDTYKFVKASIEEKNNIIIPTDPINVSDNVSNFSIDKNKFYQNRILEKEKIPFEVGTRNNISDVNRFFYENGNDMQKGIMDLLGNRVPKDYKVIFSKEQLINENGVKDSSKLGRINITTKTIELKTSSAIFKAGNNSDITWTYIHELVHAGTFNILNADESTLTENQLQGKRRLQELRKRVQELAKKDNRKFDGNPFESLDEFVSEAFTNYKFQNYLVNKKSDKKSLWTKFTEKVSQILGISDDNILNDIISTVLEITEDNIPSITMEGQIILFRESANNNIREVISDSTLQNIEDQSNNWRLRDNLYESIIDDSVKNDRVTKRVEQIAYGKNFTKSGIEYSAETYFEKNKDKLDEDGKVYIPQFGKKLTKNEFINLSNKRLEEAQIKGKIVDLYIQLVLSPESQHNRLRNEIIALERNAPSDVSFLKNTILDNLEKIVKYKLGSNFFEENINPDSRDKIIFQTTTGSKVLKTTGTSDIIIKHGDGTFTLSDTKTSIFDMEDDNITNLMFYGKTTNINIPNNKRNRAKLQTVLYALLYKLNNPEMKFRNINILHLPNRYVIDDLTNHLDSVEVAQYLEMIKGFLKDKELTKEVGWLDKDSNKSLYSLLLDEYKNNGANENFLDNLFDVKEYNTAYDTSIGITEDKYYSSFIKEQNLVEAILDELSMIMTGNLEDSYFKNSGNSTEDSSKFRQYQKKRMIELTETLLKLKKEGHYDYRTAQDIDLGKFLTGTSSDINNPMFLVWNKLKMERENIFRGRINEVNNRFDIKFDKFFKKYSDKLSSKVGLRGEGMREIFGKLIKEEEINGRIEERLILPKDSEWNNLSKDEQELITFMNDTFKSYFDNDAYLNQVATVKYKEGYLSNFTHLDLLNQKRSIADKFYYYDGWFPKVMISSSEVKDKIMQNSGVVESIPKIIKNHLRRELSNFYEKDLMETEETSAIPIRNLGNNTVVQKRNYTVDFESIFKVFIENMEHKIAYDDIYNFGRSLTIYMNEEYSSILGKHYRYNQENSKSELAFENTIKFIRDRMRMELKGTQFKKLQLTNKGKPITINNKHLDIDKALLYGTKWATGLAMHFKPISAAGNTIHGKIILRKEAMKNSLGSRFSDIDTRGIDFTNKDLTAADGEYMVMLKDEVFGQSAKNKTLLFAHEFGYLPDEYGFINNRHGNKTERMRLFNARNLYFMHNIGENYLAYITMTAQLKHMTMKVDGKDTSIFDLYKVMEYDEKFNLVEPGEGKTGKYKLQWIGPKRYIKDGTEIKEVEGLTDREIKKLKRVYAKLQGDYRKDEVTKLDGYVHTKIIITLKRFFTRVLLNGIHSKMDEQDLGYYKETNEFHEAMNSQGEMTKEQLFEWYVRRTEGKWKTLGSTIGAILSSGAQMNSTNFRTYWENLSDDQKLNVYDAILTLAQFGLMTFIGGLIFGGADDDDSLKKAWQTYLIDNPSQQYNIKDLLNTSKTVMSPVVISKAYDAVRAFSMLSVASINYGLGNQEAFNERGDLKGLNQFLKVIPYVSPMVDLYNKVDKTDTSKWFEDKSGGWFDENIYR